MHTGQYKQNKRILTSMPRVRFEPMIPVFERVKTVQALDRAATVIGSPSAYEVLINLIHSLPSYPPQHLLCDVDFFSCNAVGSHAQKMRTGAM
jgi:hypothetical protein